MPTVVLTFNTMTAVQYNGLLKAKFHAVANAMPY